MSMNGMETSEDGCLRRQFSEGVRECGCPLGEREALDILVLKFLDPTDEAFNLMEELLSNLALFEGVSNFSRAARALDIASLAFLSIDANHDLLMTKDELESYLTKDKAGKESLAWLLSKFEILQRMSFFLDGITRSEIEATRDLFHALEFVQSHFDCINGAHECRSEWDFNKDNLVKYLDKKCIPLNEHDKKGLHSLVNHIDRVKKLVGLPEDSPTAHERKID
ncbi:MAG: hypothetical protein K2Z81_19070 [Cyanobacteria bacterium]|nr:hypothetical protein [Cyanobacteriota bacterium]